MMIGICVYKFIPFSFYEKGPAYYIKYIQEKTDVIVEFLFGPSDWDVEMIIFTSKGKFAFKDLLQIPTGGFLNAERYLLESRGWIYIQKAGAYQK